MYARREGDRITNQGGGSSKVLVSALIVLVVIVLVVVVTIASFHRPSQAGASVSVTTTIFISASCARTSAITHGNATTTYVSSFIGNMTVVTTVSGFGTNATAICK